MVADYLETFRKPERARRHQVCEVVYVSNRVARRRDTWNMTVMDST